MPQRSASSLTAHDIELEEFDVLRSRRRTIIVRINGEAHTRVLDLARPEGRDYDNFRIASTFWRHADLLLERLEPSAARDAAVLTDRCLAIERLFPELRERLPV